jgi:hypothetical protein
MKATKLIVWDEAPMTHRRVFETVDRSLKDIMRSVDPRCAHPLFGGKTVVFGGDFRQIPPVVKRGLREDIIAACLKRSPLWPHIQSTRLTINMRLQCNPGDPDIQERTEFARWLLSVGEGTVPGESINKGIHTTIEIPREVMLPLDATIHTMIAAVYPGLRQKAMTPRHPDFAKYLGGRLILCSKNDEVDELNSAMIELVPGNTWDLLSVDEVLSDKQDEVPLIPVEYLHGLRFSCIAPHHLRLKVGCPIILLVNMLPEDGLCNGTRLIITEISDLS